MLTGLGFKIEAFKPKPAIQPKLEPLNPIELRFKGLGFRT